MSCVINPVPQGWRVWRGPVPPPLTDMAIVIRDHIRSYEYGDIPAQVPWKASDGSDIIAGTLKQRHTWTFRDGVLVTGLCIPGVTLVWRPTAGDVSQPPFQDSIDTPDPNAALYPAREIDWPLVGLSALAGAAVVGAFIFVTKTSPHKAASKSLRRMP